MHCIVAIMLLASLAIDYIVSRALYQTVSTCAYRSWQREYFYTWQQRGDSSVLAIYVMEGYTFSVEAMIRGHHVYKEIWIPVEGEILSCMREVGNLHDPMAVAVKKGTDVVGHVLRFQLFVPSFYGEEVLSTAE